MTARAEAEAECASLYWRSRSTVGDCLSRTSSPLSQKIAILYRASVNEDAVSQLGMVMTIEGEAQVTRREIVEDRIQLYRSDADKKPLLQRLNRIEGQVRGLRSMIEEDRYCLDELQQINAISAALRQVGVMIVEQHVREGINAAAEDSAREVAMNDVTRVLKAALRPF